MAAGARLEGGSRLAATLAAAGDQLADLAAAAADAGALLVAAGQRSAPRRTGFLADQHHAIVAAGAVQVVNTADYAAAVHARQPWLTNQLEQNTTDLLTIYTDQAQTVLDTIEGS